MTSLLIDNIGSLVTNAPELGAGPLGLLNDAALIAKDGVVVWVGPRSAASSADARVDAAGRAVIPGFVDSHAHLVFAGDRTAEFTARMSGQPYTGTSGGPDSWRRGRMRAATFMRRLISLGATRNRAQSLSASTGA